MKKKQKKISSVSINNYAQLIDVASLVVAVVFLLSVTKTAAVAAGNVRGLEWGTVPLAYILILGLLLVFLNWYNAKAKFTKAGLMALTILLSASVVWLVGLHNIWPMGQKIIPL